MASNVNAGPTLLSTLDSAVYICALWKPSHSRPVVVHYMRVDGVALSPFNPDDPDSPRLYRVPSVFAGRALKVEWLLAPTMTVDALGIALASPGSGGPRLVSSTDDPAYCMRGGIWQDDSQVQF